MDGETGTLQGVDQAALAQIRAGAAGRDRRRRPVRLRHADLAQRARSPQVNALGQRDIEAGLPMKRDTLFRIASMTKPVTSVAALMLMEEGKLKLDDPITKWLPEFADMQVLKDAQGPLDDTYPAPRDITVEDLMTHRVGPRLRLHLDRPDRPRLRERAGRRARPAARRRTPG